MSLLVWGLIATGVISVAIGLSYRRSRATQPDVVARIAKGNDSSPAALVSRSRAALAHGHALTAVELARKARDRNDDFVNALAGISGRTPLRPCVYHPAIYEVMLTAIEHSLADGSLKTQEAGMIALREWQWCDNDLSKVFTHGDHRFWGLFLSDYLRLCALALAPPPVEGSTDLTAEVVEVILAYADESASAGHLTEAGITAYLSVQLMAGRTVAKQAASAQQIPDSYDRFPSGLLIQQADIERWLEADRIASAPSTEPMPDYVTPRTRYHRPSSTSLVELYDLALRQVVVAQSNPDAWWAALDLAIYRWELLDHYDGEATAWVRDIAYDTWAAKGSAPYPKSALWSWDHFVDLFQYCYDRHCALVRTIEPGRPLDLRDAQGYENWFADFLYRCIGESGDARRLHAFEINLYATLTRSQRGNLTPVQIARLGALQRKFGSNDPVS
jgi:hypothetical protein